MIFLPHFQEPYKKSFPQKFLQEFFPLKFIEPVNGIFQETFK